MAAPAKRGDVAIFYASTSFWDRLIRLGEHGSPFTHAAIVLDGAGSVVQALPWTGVGFGHLPDDPARYVTLDPRALGADKEEKITAALNTFVTIGRGGMHYGFSDIAYQVVKYLSKFIGIEKPPWHKDDEPDCADFCGQYLIMTGATVPWTVDTCYQITPANLADLADLRPQKGV